MCKIMISPGIFPYYSKKYNIVNIKILTFFIGPLQQSFFFKKVVFQVHQQMPNRNSSDSYGPSAFWILQNLSSSVNLKAEEIQ